MSKGNVLLDCANCQNKLCYQGKDCTDIKQEVLDKYKNNETDQEIMRWASTIEARGYMKKCRLEELIEFCQQMNYQHLGIAFCIGLAEEAKLLYDILDKNFRVSSVCCKVCGIDKRTFDLPQIDEHRFEAMCDPVGQAEVLNGQKTDLNIILGLCMGHDILFSKHSLAPVTTLVVKDRVLAHNPIGALYSPYYRKNKF